MITFLVVMLMIPGMGYLYYLYEEARMNVKFYREIAEHALTQLEYLNHKKVTKKTKNKDAT